MNSNDLIIIYNMYYKPLLLYDFSLTKNIYDAEDLVRETFTKALISFEKGTI